MKTKPEKINSVQDLIDYLEFVCEQLDLALHEDHWYIILRYDCEWGLCDLCLFLSYENNTDFLDFIKPYLKNEFNHEYISGESIRGSDNYQDAIQLRIGWLKENQDKIETSFKKYDTEN